MKNETLFHRIAAAFVFVFSLAVYFKTMAPTVSFWDCGEFIACAYIQGVPHPPGAPLYLLVGRIFTLIPIFEDIARRVNLISVISSAFTVLFLYLIIVHLIKRFFTEREGFRAYIPYIGGIVGALSFAFTPSFWFNAVEAEVYAPSMFFTGLVVWLAFRWSEKHEEVGNEKYLLLIAYLVGLAIGVHLLNVLALPTVALIVFFRKYEFNIKNLIIAGIIALGLTALVYPITVMGVPTIAEAFGFAGLFLFIIILGFALVFARKTHHDTASLLLSGILLILIGYSSYGMIYIRSNLDPAIDENDPETIEKFISYLRREQYGQHTLDRFEAWQRSKTRDRYTSPMDFFWRYQVNHMYIRYFLWNFVGRSMDEVHVDWGKLLLIPLLLGIWGSYYHFVRDWPRGLAILVLFFMTGLAIVLYLNQEEPQPRERDYSYVGSFFAFAVWVGIGAAGVLDVVTRKLKGQGNFVPGFLAVTLFIISPLQMLVKNYYMQDRTGNYLPWDYSYNTLLNLGPNGIVFTNGDNDTFPLWYMQEVEHFRKDTRVANLSLLNTNWYIEQLKNQEPKVPISLSDAEIENIQPMVWPKKRTIKVPVPPDYVEREPVDEVKKYFPNLNVKPPKEIVFDLRPQFAGRFLRVQDIMILNILYANNWKKPLYFSTTVSNQNMLDGLQQYLRMDGVVMKITPYKGWKIHPDIMFDMLVNKFKYRNLNNPDVYYDRVHRGLIQNYRVAFAQLASYYLTQKDTAHFTAVIRKVFDAMPPEVIPYNQPMLGQLLEGYGFIAGVRDTSLLKSDKYSVQEVKNIGEMAMQVGYWDLASYAFDIVLKKQPNYPRVKELREFLPYLRGELPVDSLLAKNLTPDQLLYLGQAAAQQNKWQLARKIFEAVASKNPKDPRAQGYLVDVYSQLGDLQSAQRVLENWLKQNPKDNTARRRLEEIRKELARAKK